MSERGHGSPSSGPGSTTSRLARRTRLGLRWFEADRFTLESLGSLSTARPDGARAGAPAPTEPAAEPPREARRPAGPATGGACPVEARQLADPAGPCRLEPLWSPVAQPPLRPCRGRSARGPWLAASLVWALALASLVLVAALAASSSGPETYAPERDRLVLPAASGDEGRGPVPEAAAGLLRSLGGRSEEPRRGADSVLAASL